MFEARRRARRCRVADAVPRWNGSGGLWRGWNDETNIARLAHLLSCVRDRSGIEYGSEALVELGRWGFAADAEKHQGLSEPR